MGRIEVAENLGNILCPLFYVMNTEPDVWIGPAVVTFFCSVVLLMLTFVIFPSSSCPCSSWPIFKGTILAEIGTTGTPAPISSNHGPDPLLNPSH